MLYYLVLSGLFGLLLVNGFMSFNINNEGVICKVFIENDLVECMVVLLG